MTSQPSAHVNRLINDAATAMGMDLPVTFGERFLLELARRDPAALFILCIYLEMETYPTSAVDLALALEALGGTDLIDADMLLKLHTESSNPLVQMGAKMGLFVFDRQLGVQPSLRMADGIRQLRAMVMEAAAPCVAEFDETWQ